MIQIGMLEIMLALLAVVLLFAGYTEWIHKHYYPKGQIDEWYETIVQIDDQVINQSRATTHPKSFRFSEDDKGWWTIYTDHVLTGRRFRQPRFSRQSAEKHLAGASWWPHDDM